MTNEEKNLQEEPKEIPQNQNFLESIGFYHKNKISDLVKEKEASYLMVNVIARRANNISMGEKPLVNVEDPTGECYPFAYQELLQDKLIVESKTHVNKLVDVINERN